MKLVSLNCPNCGAKLEVSSYRKKVLCEYCDNHFYIHESNKYEVRHLLAGQINENQEYINAITYLDVLKEYDAAYDIFKSLVTRYVNDSELWICLLRSYTKDFSYDSYCSDEYIKTCNKYWKNFELLATKKEVLKYKDVFNKYMEKIKKSEIVILHKPDEDVKGTNHIYSLIFLGRFGLHRFLDNKIFSGLLYFLTGGLFGFGVLYDLYYASVKWSDRFEGGLLKLVFIISLFYMIMIISIFIFLKYTIV